MEPGEASAAQEVPAQTSAGADDASLSDIARHTADYARAWGDLVASEAALAKTNLLRLLVGALLLPAIAIGAVVTIDALLAAAIFDLVRDWMLAIGGVAAMNVALLLLLLRTLRGWWHSLSLPHSREAIARLWRDHDDDAKPDREGADPQRTG